MFSEALQHVCEVPRNEFPGGDQKVLRAICNKAPGGPQGESYLISAVRPVSRVARSGIPP